MLVVCHEIPPRRGSATYADSPASFVASPAHLDRPCCVWEVYKPQLEDYVTRALDPTAAPAYGVPGE